MRVELQAEVTGHRSDIFPLVASEAGLRRWLDEADLEPRVGGAVRLRLHDALAVGRVLAISTPQHISLAWTWQPGPASARSTVVAFDLIDHGERTHLTLRHVGLSPAQEELHAAVWRHWFGRLVEAARTAGQAR